MKKKNKKGEKEKNPRLQTHTKHGIKAVIFFVLAIFFLMSAFDIAGVAGVFTYEKLYYLLGVGYILLPILFVLIGYSFLKSETPEVGWPRTVSAVMFLLSSLGMIDIASGAHAGGFLGQVLARPFVALFEVYVSVIFLGAILIISILVMFDTKLELFQLWKNIWAILKRKKIETIPARDEKEIKEIEKAIEEEEAPASEGVGKKFKKALGMSTTGDDEEIEFKASARGGSAFGKSYVPPPLNLLEEDRGKPNTGDIKANANIIKRTLLNFGIEVEMDEVTVGPTVTRYALKPAEGVKLSRIVG